MSIREKFSSNKDIEYDQYQAKIVDRLEELQKEILDERSIVNKFLSLFREEKPKSNGIYLWGDVGRGKTLIMMTFLNLIKNRKGIFHYIDFMNYVHDQLNSFSGLKNPLRKISKNLCKNRLIFIDDILKKGIN